MRVEVFVTVAETTRKRQAVLRAIFAQLMLPTLLVLLIACAIVRFSVRAGLHPLLVRLLGSGPGAAQSAELPAPANGERRTADAAATRSTIAVQEVNA